MLVLLSETAHSRFGPDLATAGDGVAFLRMQPDGSVLPPDAGLPEVAWLSSDLFRPGAPLRPFMALVLTDRVPWLHTASAGTDHPVFATLLAQGTRITTSHVTGGPIAEYVLRAVLDHYQQPERWAAARSSHTWEPHEFREVQGTTWVVVGLGAIGRAVAERATAFGATVIGVRRTPEGSEPVAECVPPDQLPAVVGRADVVVLAAPGGSATHHMVDAGLLAEMREHSVLVNVGRGSLVDEDALRIALDRGVPEVAILDVVDAEPLAPEHWLWTHPRVVLTPHSSALGLGRSARGAAAFAANLAAYTRGASLADEVTGAHSS